MQKTITILSLLLVVAPCAYAQSPSPSATPTSTLSPLAASSLVAPVPLATPAVVALAFEVGINGGAFGLASGTMTVPVGSTVALALTGATLPAQMAFRINGKLLTFPTIAPLSFIADKPGLWQISLATVGYWTNSVSITALPPPPTPASTPTPTPSATAMP